MTDGVKEMMDTLLTIDHVNDIAIVTLNRPAARNALSLGLQQEIATTFQALGGDTRVSTIILTGAGNSAFCAGLDLRELAAGVDLVNGPVNPVAAVAACPIPVIGAINGAAITGGFELALACDVLIASDNAFFADTHAKMGVMPGWGLSQRLARRIGIGRALELSLSARPLSAAQALQWGLVNHVAPADTLLSQALDLARDIAQWDDAFIRKYKRLIKEGFGLPEQEAMARERTISGAFNAKLNAAEVGKR
ncbi:MAG: enoyl-CoA hydratase [Caenibius sp.]